MANSSMESDSSSNSENMDQKPRDIFQGKALIDRLLVYFSKFEGSREKARKYAQKLLDLGHIESSSHSTRFEDSLHEYKWTDVASVVNKAKAKAQENGGDGVAECPVITESLPPVVMRQKDGRTTFRISIEADNCDGAEIQAHIRTNPPTVPAKNAAVCTATKNEGTVQYSDHRNGKMISFVTETSKTEEVLRLVPVSAMSQRSVVHDDSSSEVIPFDLKIIARSPDRKKGKADIVQNDDSAGHNELGQNKSRTTGVTSSIVNADAPGKGDAPSTNSSFVENNSQEPLSGYPSVEYVKSISKMGTIAAPSQRPKPKPGVHKYKWDTFKENTRTPTHRETTDFVCRPNNSLASSAGTPGREKSGSASSTSHNNSSSKSNSSGVSEPQVQQNGSSRKFKFKEDDDWIKMRRDYLEHEEIREITKISHEHQVEMFDDPGLSLHSSGLYDTIEEEPEENDVSEPLLRPNPDSNKLLSPPPHPLITISPPPSPTPQSPPKPLDQGLKSLFWSKISCSGVAEEEAEDNFWLSMDRQAKFNEEEFTRLFSKPSSSPLQKQPRKVFQEDVSGSETLKVLGTERSRQVGIRASSIHLPAEDIHDAIINMDDSILNLDALEALYDVRPTSDELDDIADELKRKPNGILDKPEQFVLMLAMLGNLDERLKIWIFIKKFPDKVLDIKEQLNIVSSVCIQVVRNATLQKLLETTLAVGNYMNKGTQRGDADGYYFDILPKLKDVKSKGGDSNLMLYLVKWYIEQQEKCNGNSDIMQREESEASSFTKSETNDDCGLPNQASLQKACSASMQDTLEEIENLSVELNECKAKLIPAVVEGATCLPEIKPFNDRMKDFIIQAEVALAELQNLFAETSEITNEFKRYYVPGDAKMESFVGMLKHLCAFCDNFRFYWDEEKRSVAKEAFFNTEKARRQRLAAVKIAKSPSALKARFLEKRRRERGSEFCQIEEPEGTGRAHTPKGRFSRPIPVGETTKVHLPGRHARSKTENDRQSSPSRTPLLESPSANGISKQIKRQPTPIRHLPVILPRQDKSLVANGRLMEDGRVSEHQRNESYASRHAREEVSLNSSGGLSKMKQAMLKRRMLLKSKTC